jgi:hypothetical protein
MKNGDCMLAIGMNSEKRWTRCPNRGSTAFTEKGAPALLQRMRKNRSYYRVFQARTADRAESKALPGRLRSTTFTCQSLIFSAGVALTAMADGSLREELRSDIDSGTVLALGKECDAKVVNPQAIAAAGSTSHGSDQLLPSSTRSTPWALRTCSASAVKLRAWPRASTAFGSDNRAAPAQRQWASSKRRISFVGSCADDRGNRPMHGTRCEFVCSRSPPCCSSCAS